MKIRNPKSDHSPFSTGWVAQPLFKGCGEIRKVLLISVLVLVFLFSASQALAALVPCGGEGQPECQFCHLFVMLDTIIDFVLIYIVFPVATMLLVIGGGMFLLSAGDPTKLAQGKAVMTSVIMGLIIIFSSWLLINLFFSAIRISNFALRFTGPDKWAVINCPI